MVRCDGVDRGEPKVPGPPWRSDLDVGLEARRRGVCFLHSAHLRVGLRSGLAPERRPKSELGVVRTSFRKCTLGARIGTARRFHGSGFELGVDSRPASRPGAELGQIGPRSLTSTRAPKVRAKISLRLCVRHHEVAQMRWSRDLELVKAALGDIFPESVGASGKKVILATSAQKGSEKGQRESRSSGARRTARSSG